MLKDIIITSVSLSRLHCMKYQDFQSPHAPRGGSHFRLKTYYSCTDGGMIGVKKQRHSDLLGLFWWLHRQDWRQRKASRSGHMYQLGTYFSKKSNESKTNWRSKRGIVRTCWPSLGDAYGSVGGAVDSNSLPYFRKHPHTLFSNPVGNMAVCGLKQCDFVVYTNQGVYNGENRFLWRLLEVNNQHSSVILHWKSDYNLQLGANTDSHQIDNTWMCKM